jgi:hypothetical protein
VLIGPLSCVNGDCTEAFTFSLMNILINANQPVHFYGYVHEVHMLQVIRNCKVMSVVPAVDRIDQ